MPIGVSIVTSQSPWMLTLNLQRFPAHRSPYRAPPFVFEELLDSVRDSRTIATIKQMQCEIEARRHAPRRNQISIVDDTGRDRMHTCGLE